MRPFEYVLGTLFEPSDYLKGYDIYYRVDYYQEKTTMYIESQSIDIGATRSVFGGVAHMINTEYANYHNSFFISELVYENTEASEKVEKSSGQYTEYNYVFKKLSENLDKEVNKG